MYAEELYTLCEHDKCDARTKLESQVQISLYPAYGTCAYGEDSIQSAHLHNLSLSFRAEEMLDPWLPIEPP